jgi:hypothetical protein
MSALQKRKMVQHDRDVRFVRAQRAIADGSSVSAPTTEPRKRNNEFLGTRWLGGRPL